MTARTMSAVVSTLSVLGLLAGCAQAGHGAWERATPVYDGPGDYEVHNTTVCLVRASTVGSTPADARLVNEISPDATATVSVPAGRHLSLATVVNPVPVPFAGTRGCGERDAIEVRRVPETR